MQSAVPLALPTRAVSSLFLYAAAIVVWMLASTTPSSAFGTCPPGCPYPAPFCCCAAPCPVRDDTILELYKEPREHRSRNETGQGGQTGGQPGGQWGGQAGQESGEQDRMGIEPGQRLLAELYGQGGDINNLEDLRRAQAEAKPGEGPELSWLVLQRLILETLKSEGRGQEGEGEGEDQAGNEGNKGPGDCPNLRGPLGSLQVTSNFGYRIHPVHGHRRLHAGTDFRAAQGTPVYASASGRVSRAGVAGGYGNLIEIGHQGSCSTRYAHLSRMVVAPGTQVSQGQLIGYSGGARNTPGAGTSTGPHLHFEVRAGGRAHDPMQFLGGGRQNISTAAAGTTNRSTTGGSSTTVPTGVQGSNRQIVGVTQAGAGFTTVRYADGTVERRDGTRAWRNNNPGNIEYGSFARSLGAVGSDGRFAVFPDFNTGRAAKESLLFNSSSYRNLDIASAIRRYAPPNENHTAGYVRSVAGALGVSANTPLSALSPQQRQVMLDAMQRVEGFRAGNSRRIGSPSFLPDFTGQVANLPSLNLQTAAQNFNVGGINVGQIMNMAGSVMGGGMPQMPQGGGAGNQIGSVISMISQLAQAFNQSTFIEAPTVGAGASLQMRDTRMTDLRQIGLYAQAGGMVYNNEIEEFINRSRILEGMQGAAQNWPEDLAVRSILQAEVMRELSRLATMMTAFVQTEVARRRSQDVVNVVDASPRINANTQPLVREPAPGERERTEALSTFREMEAAHRDLVRLYDDLRFNEQAQAQMAQSYADVLEHERVKFDLFEIEKGILAGFREIETAIRQRSGRSPEEEWIEVRRRLAQLDGTNFFDTSTKWNAALAASRQIASLYDQFDLGALETRRIRSSSPPPPPPTSWQTVDGPLRSSLRVSSRNTDLLTRYQIQTWREECFNSGSGTECEYRWEDPFLVAFQFYLEAKKRKDRLDLVRRGNQPALRNLVLNELARDPAPRACLTAVGELNADRSTGRGVRDEALTELWGHLVDIHPECAPRTWRNILPEDPFASGGFYVEAGEPISHMFLRGLDASIWAARSAIAENEARSGRIEETREEIRRLSAQIAAIQNRSVNGANLRTALEQSGLSHYTLGLDIVNRQVETVLRSAAMGTGTSNPHVSVTDVQNAIRAATPSNIQSGNFPFGIRWRVDTINGRTLVSHHPSFVFNGGGATERASVSGSTGCINSFSMEFMLDGDRLIRFAPAMATLAVCPEEEGRRNQADLLAFFDQAGLRAGAPAGSLQWRFEGQNLVLSGPSGSMRLSVN